MCTCKLCTERPVSEGEPSATRPMMERVSFAHQSHSSTEQGSGELGWQGLRQPRPALKVKSNLRAGIATGIARYSALIPPLFRLFRAIPSRIGQSNLSSELFRRFDLLRHACTRQASASERGEHTVYPRWEGDSA